MLRRIAILPLALLLLLAARPAAAQADNPVRAEIAVAPGELTVGDPIALTLTVTHPEGSTVILPQLEETWGDFTVYAQAPPATTSNGDGTETTTQTLDVRLFAPGSFSTPPLPLTVADAAGQLTEVTAPPVPVQVASVLVAGDTALRDIKPQATLPIAAVWPWLVGGALVAALAGGFVWWRRRRARRALAPVDNRLPHEVALDELARIERLGLPQAGRFKEHYSLVADCMRLYVEQAYRLPALERTTGEIQADLRKASVDPPFAAQLIPLLDAADLVKFAKVTPDATDAQQLVVEARAIVAMTQPRPGEDTTPGENGHGPRPMSAEAAARAFSRNGAQQQTEVNA